MKLNLLIIFFLMPFFLIAQDKGYKVVDDLEKINTRLSKTAKSINTIDCDFVQEKKLSILSETITSKGHLTFKKDNKLRWEYTEPFSYLVILNDNKIFIKDENQENKFDMQSNKMFKEINNLIISSIQGKISDSKEFEFSAYENSQFYLVQLTPLSKNIQEFFSKIDIHFDKAENTVSRINMHEVGGDNTLIKFYNKQFNKSIPDEKFSFR